MRLMHYILGFPPYRSGGMTKFAFDLMKVQSKDHPVMALWPGRMMLFSKNIKIMKLESVEGIESFELVNPLPVSLDEGIVKPYRFMVPCEITVFIDFLKHTKPDVIHIHTLMGLYWEFIKAANELGIRTIFTTHDYFGLCQRVNLFRRGDVCQNNGECRNCADCNTNGLPLWKIYLMQSSLYRSLKNLAVVKVLRRSHRTAIFQIDNKIPATRNVKSEEYKELRNYYSDMLELISLIHFNSTLARDVYLNYVKPRSWKVISISHGDVSDHRDEIQWKPKDELRITYLGPARALKGFYILKEALDELWDGGKRDFSLKLFTPVKNPSPYMEIRPGGYMTDELKGIFENTDVMVAPSIWYETFGFTVIEAFSYGVPIIISDHVGAKDVVAEAAIIVKAGSVRDLKEAIESLTEEFQRKERKQIKSLPGPKTLDILSSELRDLYCG